MDQEISIVFDRELIHGALLDWISPNERLTGFKKKTWKIVAPTARGDPDLPIVELVDMDKIREDYVQLRKFYENPTGEDTISSQVAEGYESDLYENLEEYVEDGVILVEDGEQ